jgi:hypothetical protein
MCSLSSSYSLYSLLALLALITTQHSLLTTHYLLLTSTYYSLLTACYPHSPLTTYYSQIFWNVLILELVLICVNYRPPDGSADEKRGGGRRSVGGGGGGETSETKVDFSWQAIPLVETLITGLLAAVITAFIVLLCSMVFKWGNSRMRRCAVVRGCE